MSDPRRSVLDPAQGHLDPSTPLVDRRGFLTAAGAASIAALLTGACGGGDGAGPTGPGGTGGNGGGGGGGALPSGVTRSGNILRIDLSAAATLQGTNGFIIVSDPPTVVVNLGNDTFRAFTARCPHEGCLVGSVSNRRIVCPCHGSTFDADNGSVLVGPATRGLNSFAVDFAAATRVLTVTTA